MDILKLVIIRQIDTVLKLQQCHWRHVGRRTLADSCDHPYHSLCITDSLCQVIGKLIGLTRMSIISTECL